MGLTRRDFLTLGAGAAVAIPFTPVPWKLLDDSAKWSQNWSWIPRPPRGPKSLRCSTCTLCPAGCGIEARCVGRNVIGIAPVAGHPVSRGALCPYAFGAHQLAYHPARITRPVENKVIARINSRVKAGTMAILDERPGRAVSSAYQRLVSARGGIYIVPERREMTTLECMARGSQLNASNLGLDLENVRTIVSFGAPVLESWATPGRILSLWKDGRLAIVQVDANSSNTAALAPHWLTARPGSEGAVADYLAGVTSLEEASRKTGIPAERLLPAASFIKDRGPMLAISGGGLSAEDEQRVAALNRGSNAIVARPSTDAVLATKLSSVSRGSIDILFVDHGLLGGSVDYDSIRTKLRPDGLLVSLSPYRAGVAARADFVIPTPAFGESLDEAPVPWDATLPSYALAPPITDAPGGIITAIEFISRVAGAPTTPEAVIRGKVESLWKARRGEVFAFAERATKPMAEFQSRTDLWKVFGAGACWIDRDAKATTVNVHEASGASLSGPLAFARGTAVAPPLVRNPQV